MKLSDQVVILRDGTPINLCGTPRSKHSFIAYFLYDKFLHLNIIKYKIDLQIALIGLLLVDTSS